jgi:hypothetical protein
MQPTNLEATIASLITGMRAKSQDSPEAIARCVTALFFDPNPVLITPDYTAPCECHSWTARIRDHIWQHKPGYPKYDPQIEMAIVSKRHYDQMMTDLKKSID